MRINCKYNSVLILEKRGKITDELIKKFSAWKHSGFSINNQVFG